MKLKEFEPKEISDDTKLLILQTEKNAPAAELDHFNKRVGELLEENDIEIPYIVFNGKAITDEDFVTNMNFEQYIRNIVIDKIVEREKLKNNNPKYETYRPK